MKAKYINPFTDFGFKKLFGEEASKPQLIDFLNALLPNENTITNLSFKNTEQLGITEIDRKAVYDIYCENDRGEKFIVELQKAKQNFFKERTIFYSTFPIREQAEKGVWNYNLKAVYCIGILDFTFDDYQSNENKHEVLHTIKLKNQHGQVFYDKLTYVYLEIPNFKKTETELSTRLDKWLYFIKHLEDLEVIPNMFTDAIFNQAFEVASIANLRKADLENYEISLKAFRDNKNIVDTAFDEGIELGIEKRKVLEKKEIVRNGRKIGLTMQQLIALTGLTEGEINNISDE